MDDPAGSEPDPEATLTENGIEVRYVETEAERVLVFERHVGAAGRGESADSSIEGQTVVVAQNREGYGMVKVQSSISGDELERYYGFDMALDHAAELLGIVSGALPVPEPAADMGM